MHHMCLLMDLSHYVSLIGYGLADLLSGAADIFEDP